MLSALTLELTELFRMVVENRLDTMTPYVLLEQETWFENDALFVRSFLKPGMRVIDIGANCGFYTLLAAACVGTGGHVWAYEPGVKAARLLLESLKLNEAGNVSLFLTAMAETQGVAWFNERPDTEFSMIVDGPGGQAREAYTDCLDRLHGVGEVTGVDFIKIDAEGAEAAIIRGGSSFFKAESPLVMLEVTAEKGTQFEAARLLRDLGYRFYRFIPGLGCLAPLIEDKASDLVLNIFLCKVDREETLRDAGLLVTAEAMTVDYPPADPALLGQYFSNIAVMWNCPELQSCKAPAGDGYAEACGDLLLSAEGHRPIGERMARLLRAEAYCESHFRPDKPTPPLEYMLSFTRIWFALGRTGLGLGVLKVLRENSQLTELTPTIPFLALTTRWDATPARKGGFSPWLASMVAVTFSNTASRSSFWEPDATRAAYRLARDQGYLDEDLERQFALCALRSGQRFEDPVFLPGSAVRNRALWIEIMFRLMSDPMNGTQLITGATPLAEEDLFAATT